MLSIFDPRIRSKNFNFADPAKIVDNPARDGKKEREGGKREGRGED